MIKDHEVKLVDFKFTDLPGAWQHFTTTLTEYNEDIFTEGLGFDGSSIRGWKAINATDMLVIPDPTTAWIDIFNAEPTLSLICTIVDPITREPYNRDPRGVAEKAEAYLQEHRHRRHRLLRTGSGIFHLRRCALQLHRKQHPSYLSIAARGIGTAAARSFPNLGYKIRAKEGYFPVAPADTLQDIRNEMCLELEKAGIPIERQHHEVATAGQAEIDIRFAPLKTMGDYMQYYKYIVRNVAKKHNKTVTFMPKPLFGDNGSGMHTHMSLWKDGKPLFAGNGYAGLSEMALFFIGGILKHAPALTCHHQSDHEQLQAARARIRSAGQSRLLRAQSLGRDPHSDLLGQSEIEAHRIPHAGRGGESVSCLRRAAPGGTRWHPEPHRSRRSARQESLRTSAGRTGERPERAGFARRSDRSARGGSCVPAQRRCLQRRLHRNWIEMKQKEYDALRLRPHPFEFQMYYDV